MKIFDLEQEIMECWNVVDDIQLVTSHFVDHSIGHSDDDIMNKYLAISYLYSVKFEKLWRTFEEVCKEYHTARKLSGIERDEELQQLFNDDEMLGPWFCEEHE